MLGRILRSLREMGRGLEWLFTSDRIACIIYIGRYSVFTIMPISILSSQHIINVLNRIGVIANRTMGVDVIGRSNIHARERHDTKNLENVKNSMKIFTEAIRSSVGGWAGSRGAGMGWTIACETKTSWGSFFTVETEETWKLSTWNKILDKNSLMSLDSVFQLFNDFKNRFTLIMFFSY